MAVRAKRDASIWHTPTSLPMSFHRGEEVDGDLGVWLSQNDPKNFEVVDGHPEPQDDVIPVQDRTYEQARAVALADAAADPALYGYKAANGDPSAFPDPRQAAEADRRYAERQKAGDLPDGLVELHARIASGVTRQTLDTGPIGVQADGEVAAPAGRRPSPAWDRTDTPIVPGVASGPSDQDIRDRDAAQAAADGIARGSDVFEVASDVDEDADDDEGDPHEPAAQQPVGKFDPSEHTGPEVIEYAKKHPAERARLRAAEKSGKARTTVLVALAD